MKVIIKKTNEIKDVSFGYAVNYLIPQGLAVLATEREMEKRTEKEEREKVKKVEKSRKSRERAVRLAGKKFEIRKKAGKSGKLYGSLDKKELAEVIGTGKEEVVLKEPIKKTGEYEVGLKIGKEKIKVKVKVRNP